MKEQTKKQIKKCVMSCDESRKVTQLQQNWVAQDSSWFGIWKRAVFKNSGWNLADAVLENGAADRALSLHNYCKFTENYKHSSRYDIKNDIACFLLVYQQCNFDKV